MVTEIPPAAGDGTSSSNCLMAAAAGGGGGAAGNAEVEEVATIKEPPTEPVAAHKPDHGSSADDSMGCAWQLWIQ